MTPTSPRGRKPGRRSSSTSRSSPTASADTRRWGTYPQPSTNGKTLNSLSTFRGEFQEGLCAWTRTEGPNAGLVGAVSNYAAPPQQVPPGYDHLDGLAAFAAR